MNERIYVHFEVQCIYERISLLHDIVRSVAPIRTGAAMPPSSPARGSEERCKFPKKPKSNLVHFGVQFLHFVTTIRIIFMRIKCMIHPQLISLINVSLSQIS